MYDLPLGITDPLDEIAVAAGSISGLTNWLIRRGWTGETLQMLGVGFLMVAGYTVHYSHRIRTIAFGCWLLLNSFAFAVSYTRGDIVSMLQFRFVIQFCVGMALWRLIYSLNPESWLLWIAGWPAVGLSGINTILLWKYRTTDNGNTRRALTKYLKVSRWWGASTWNIFYLVLLAASGIRMS